MAQPSKPFSYRQARDERDRLLDRWDITAEGGRLIALTYTRADARFLTIALNYFDRLYAVLKHCKGEFELHSLPVQRPAYDDLVRLQEDIEADLQRQD
jgi:hypothetical protein